MLSSFFWTISKTFYVCLISKSARFIFGLVTEGVVWGLVALETDWVTDFGEVGSTELSNGEIFAGDLGERGWVTFNCDTGCLIELWETVGSISLGDEAETMLLLATWGFYTTFCLYGFLSISASTFCLISLISLGLGWYL